MNMFATPKSVSYVASAEPIDPNAKYLVVLMEIKDEGVSQFADQADADPPHNLGWTFRLHNMDKTPVLNIDGDVYEHHDFTSNRTGKGGARTAKAREWIEALLGRAVDDGEINDSLPGQLIHKAAVILFETKEVTGRNGETYERLRIMRMSPMKDGGQPMPQAAAISPRQGAAPLPVAAPSLDAVLAGRPQGAPAARTPDPDNELPF
jgi:hypothetical protein